VVIIGDIHTDLVSVRKIMEEHGDDIYIALGDLSMYYNKVLMEQDKSSIRKNPNIIDLYKALNDDLIEPLKYKLYTIKGNHDDYASYNKFKNINVHYVNNAEILVLDGYRVCFYGGIYSPVHFYSKSLKDRLNRFYTVDEYNSIIKNKDSIDILLTHEGPAKIMEKRIGSTKDEGSNIIYELFNALKHNIKYHFHGHHHMYYNKIVDNVNVIGLNKLDNKGSYYEIPKS